jgi:hypothetical protein
MAKLTGRPFAGHNTLNSHFFVNCTRYLDRFAVNPNEVSFVYPRPDRPLLDVATYLVLGASILLSQVVLFIFSIIIGIGILQKQRWAWFVGIGLPVAALFVYLLAVVLLPPYATKDRLASIVISLVSLFLLSTRDVRAYLMPLTKT